MPRLIRILQYGPISIPNEERAPYTRMGGNLLDSAEPPQAGRERHVRNFGIPFQGPVSTIARSKLILSAQYDGEVIPGVLLGIAIACES